MAVTAPESVKRTTVRPFHAQAFSRPFHGLLLFTLRFHSTKVLGYFHSSAVADWMKYFLCKAYSNNFNSAWSRSGIAESASAGYLSNKGAGAATRCSFRVDLISSAFTTA